MTFITFDSLCGKGKNQRIIMSNIRLEALKTKAKLLQKAKRGTGKLIQLKEAYALIAKAAGYSSWQDMKATLDSNDKFCPKGHSAIWKAWFASYEEALLHLKENQFLVPYMKDFFICNADYIQFLGLELNDSDLLKAGTNWVKPKDMQAFERLSKKIAQKQI